MKRTIKILVPLLLIAAIVLGAWWYLFEYDTAFARDLLLQQARRAEANGNYKTAIWFYELAYKQSEGNDQVALELADYFIANGNYTKAEYTLTKAIEDGGGVELYIALCSTYVQQNKLLDAVRMLDQIADPVIRSHLDALRPAAPSASSPSGYYSQYISVGLEASGGSLYFSTDEQYPSLDVDGYTEAIPLERGKTTIFALTVAENGLVSPLAVYTYTIEDVIEEVTFRDSAMESAIRKLLGVDPDRKIYSNELWDIREFTMPASAISSADLAWLPNLSKLTLQQAAYEDLSALSYLTDLQELHISSSVLASGDLKIIGKLPALEKLTLSNCSLSSIAGLEKATDLTYLDLSNNAIRDIAGLGVMTKLTELNLSSNAVVSLEPIAGLTSLTKLDVSSNSLVSMAPLKDLTALTHLNVSSNGLMKLEGMEKMTALLEFSAAHNNFVEIAGLSACKNLQVLDVSHNFLLSIQVVSGMTKLQQLNFAYNEVSQLPTFRTTCPMTVINGAHNDLTSLEALRNLKKLEYVYMDYNKDIQYVNLLSVLSNLKQVNVYGTKVSNVKTLTDKGVIVNFTPL